MARIDEDEFNKALDNAITEAAQWQQEHLSEDRERNYEYYLGRMQPGPNGRSQAVSWDVFETVESALPDLIEIFLSADNIAEYEPDGEKDEAFAEQATDYINYIVNKQNPGFLIFNTWIKDALLSKIGIVRAYWAEKTTTRDKEYTGIDEDQLTLLVEDDDVEIVEQDSRKDPEDVAARKQAEAALNTLAPDVQMQVMAHLAQPVAKLYDVTIRRTTKAGRIYIDNVQPENFLITARAKTIADSDLCGELKTMTRSEMREHDFNKEDIKEIRSFDTITLDGEGIAQQADDDTLAHVGWGNGNEHNDKPTEEILVFDGFIRIDYDGDGIAEWRRVIKGGNVTLLNEAADGPDFCSMSPILIPHRLTGLALADIVAPLQDASTAMQRQYIDSLMLANNPRTFAVESQVNLDDLLNPRIGGVVRMKAPGQAGPLQTSVVAQSALEGIEFMDSRRELRTGITRYNQGLDADSLNKTATGVTKIMSAGDRRKLMMARIMAETGIKDLFRLLLKLVTDNQDKKATIRLRGEWVEMNPQDWQPDMNVTVETGMGTGDKSQLLQIFQMILEVQKEAMINKLPIVDLSHMYNTMESMLKAAGIKNIQKYFGDPKKADPNAKPAEPEKTPEQALAEATVEAEKIKAQVAMARMEHDSAMKDKDIQIKAVELQIKQADLQLKQADLELKKAEAVHHAETVNRQEDRKDIELMGRGTGVL